MASYITTSKHYSAFKFKCDCGALGPMRMQRDKAEQDRREHMARRHPKWDVSNLFRGR
ncbi:hypothetical protein ACLF6K_26030 [Streptomyces xanthophaeus]|uniref:hypothetical protein n=1 Tax=Streptomyces xanthophaeus TaxID=67385 RepID=UPI00398FA22C